LRLKVAVPIALILIFILLYFAFKSVKEALIIYSAIPFAAVGGILFLWLRDLPFSISAGVGFIALFGIAVLNGIVLIEEFKELKHKGMKTDNELIIFGAKSRLRAVLLTALAAALGFLPMAISHGAGAEVQRPLATVVIGGLITSTLLTLLVLPVLYAIFDSKKDRKRFHLKSKKEVIISVLLLLFSVGINAQDKGLSLEELKQLTYKNNADLKALNLKVDRSEILINSAYNFNKTDVFYNYENDKIDSNIGVLNTFGIKQDFEFPTIYNAQKKFQKSKVAIENSALKIQRKRIEKALFSAYYRYQFIKEKALVYKYLDSLYAKFAHNAKRRFELGETNYLEKITSKSKQMQIQMSYQQVQEDVKSALIQIQKIVQSNDSFTIAIEPLHKLELHNSSVKENDGLLYYQAQSKSLSLKTKLEKKRLLPGFNLEYSYGENTFLNGNISTFQVGLKIPLLNRAQKSKIKASKITEAILEQETINYESQLEAKYNQLLTKLKAYENMMNYYDSEGQSVSKAILKTANLSFKHGEIDFFQYIQSIEHAYNITLSYLENVNNYNQTIIQLNHLTL
jgi:cobalt-zinc-cadmium resistance protein CzcA